MSKGKSNTGKELSIDERRLLDKYASAIECASLRGYYTAVSQTDMIQLHAIYKRHINPGHTPNTWCGNCNMNVLRGLAVFLKKAE